MMYYLFRVRTKENVQKRRLISIEIGKELRDVEEALKKAITINLEYCALVAREKNAKTLAGIVIGSQDACGIKTGPIKIRTVSNKASKYVYGAACIVSWQDMMLSNLYGIMEKQDIPELVTYYCGLKDKISILQELILWNNEYQRKYLLAADNAILWKILNLEIDRRNEDFLFYAPFIDLPEIQRIYDEREKAERDNNTEKYVLIQELCKYKSYKNKENRLHNLDLYCLRLLFSVVLMESENFNGLPEEAKETMSLMEEAEWIKEICLNGGASSRELLQEQCLPFFAEVYEHWKEENYKIILERYGAERAKDLALPNHDKGKITEGAKVKALCSKSEWAYRKRLKRTVALLEEILLWTSVYTRPMIKDQEPAEIRKYLENEILERKEEYTRDELERMDISELGQIYDEWARECWEYKEERERLLYTLSNLHMDYTPEQLRKMDIIKLRALNHEIYGET